MDAEEDAIISSSITTFAKGYTVPEDGVAHVPEVASGRDVQTAMDDGGQWVLKKNHGFGYDKDGDLGCFVETPTWFVKAQHMSVGPNVGWARLAPDHEVVSYESVMQVRVYCSRQQAVPEMPGMFFAFRLRTSSMSTSRRSAAAAITSAPSASARSREADCIVCRRKAATSTSSTVDKGSRRR